MFCISRVAVHDKSSVLHGFRIAVPNKGTVYVISRLLKLIMPAKETATSFSILNVAVAESSVFLISSVAIPDEELPLILRTTVPTRVPVCNKGFMCRVADTCTLVGWDSVGMVHIVKVPDTGTCVCRGIGCAGSVHVAIS